MFNLLVIYLRLISVQDLIVNYHSKLDMKLMTIRYIYPNLYKLDWIYNLYQLGHI